MADLDNCTEPYIQAWLDNITKELGPINVIHWNVSGITIKQSNLLEVDKWTADAGRLDDAMLKVKGESPW